MSLKIKTLCIILCLMIVYVAAHGAINRFIFIPGFIYLEQREAGKNLNRPLEAIRNEVNHLSSLTHDWASWDDTYDYMRSGNPAYKTSNLVPMETYSLNVLNVLILCDNNGKIIWKRTVDLETQKDIRIPEIPDGFIPSGHPLVTKGTPGKDGRNELTGFLKTSFGPLMIAARPILTSTNAGPAKGKLFMGRFLSTDLTSKLNAQTDVDFEIIPLDEKTTTAHPGIQDLWNEKTERFMDASHRNNLYLYATLKDISAKPVGLVKVTMAREILRKGMETLNYSMISVVAAGFLMLLMTVVLLHWTILSPLSVLTQHAVDVEETGNLSARLDFNRSDEIGILARRFDSMLIKLSEVRSELLDQSYYAGLAGVASDILHHSGNILMPMSQKIETLKGICKNMPKESIQKAVKELETGVNDPEREKNLQRFLTLSSLEMGRSFENAASLLDDLEQHAKEIEGIMGRLEKVSRPGKTAQLLVPEDLLHEAYSRMPENLKNACRIRFQDNTKSLPPIKAEPLVLAQIFNALFCHGAVIAMDAAKDQAEVTVHGETGSKDSKKMVIISVTGNGPGIDPQHVKTIFNRNCPIGPGDSFHASLHWCSNVVSAMGGELAVTSHETGTSFHLVLPQGGDV
jgi:sensor domain CHASE-containing protein